MPEGDQETFWDEAIESARRGDILARILRTCLWLQSNAGYRVLTADLIQWMHKELFGALFPRVAGKVCGESLQLDVRVGPHFGASWQGCTALFEDLSTEFARYIREGLDRLAESVDGQLRERALEVAALHHGRFIGIHPFVNGNGRTGRLCVNYFAIRYSLNRIVVPMSRTTRTDYERTLEHFLRTDDIHPLVEYLRPVMLP